MPASIDYSKAEIERLTAIIAEQAREIDTLRAAVLGAGMVSHDGQDFCEACGTPISEANWYMVDNESVYLCATCGGDDV